jgi:DNA-binding MarR family transcriptional regulator
MKTVTSEALCFGLYAASRSLTRRYKSALSPFGLTYTQYLVLAQLWEAPALRMRTLENDLALDSNTLTPVIQKLEAKDLLHRRRAAGDERSIILRLTDKGLALEKKISPLIAQIETETGLTDQERAALASLLNKLAGAYMQKPRT